MKALLQRIRQILRDRRVRRFFTRFVSTIAAIVVFVTTYALILPAITLEKVAACGIEEHQHDASCYKNVLTCGLKESDDHRHDDSCYKVVRDLICEIHEHQHGEECYDENGELTCTLAEHTHGDNCYEEHRELTCGIPESEGHHHDASCYKKELTCGKEVHVHSAACYHSDAESETAAEIAATAGTKSSASAGAGTTSTASGTANTDASDVGADASSVGSASVSTGTTDGKTGRDAGKNHGSTESVNGGGAGAADSSTGNDASAAATTNVMPEEVKENLSDGYVPQLDPVNMEAVLGKNTGFYYYDASAAAENGQDIPADSSQITDWKKYKDDDVLEAADILRLYLPYTIPAGTLNSTNQIARYRLPGNIRLDDAQIVAINETENGLAGSFVNYDTLEITDPDKYEYYRGAEAVEGIRKPDQDANDYLYDLVKHGKSGEEYISAVVKAENVFDEKTGDYLGQDLIFIFTPYTIEKNQNEYDTTGKPVKAGEKITGWFACDFNCSQIDWAESNEASPNSDDVSDKKTNQEENDESGIKTAEIILVNEDKETGIEEIKETLAMVEKAVEEEGESTDENEQTEEGSTEDAAEASTEDSAGVSEDNSAKNEQSGESDSADSALENESAETEGDSKEEKAEEALNEEEKKSAYQSGKLNASGDGYSIAVEYREDAQIPTNAKLSVKEITKDSAPEAYDECLKQAGEQIGGSVYDTDTIVDEKSSRFFDIQILSEDEFGRLVKVEPAARVLVSIRLDGRNVDTVGAGDEKNAANSQGNVQKPSILHFSENGTEVIASQVVTGDNAASSSQAPADGKDIENTRTVTAVSTDTDNQGIQFITDSFSAYGVIYSTIRTTLLTASGEDYEISLHYDLEAGIPEGSELRVREIKAGTTEYDEYLNESAIQMSLLPEDVAFARFFDIEILKDGVKIEPKTSVNVQIDNKSAIQTADAGELSVVHFGDNGVEQIREIGISEDGTQFAYSQSSFSVTGIVVPQAQAVSGHTYVVVLEYEGNYYSIDNDGYLTQTTYDPGNNTVVTTMPMLWTYYKNGSNSYLRHASTAKHIDPSTQVADQWYYRYIDPRSVTGLVEESGNQDFHATSTITYTGSTITSSSNNNYRIGVINDNGKLKICGQEDGTSANVMLADVYNFVPGVNPNKDTVSHIDVSIAGTAEIDVPLAYGTYYYGNGSEAFTVSADNQKTITLSENVPINTDDMKNARITAYKRDANGQKVEIPNAFYITGYSANSATEYSTQQVRIEGSFKVADVPESVYNNVNSNGQFPRGSESGDVYAAPYTAGQSLNESATYRQARLDNRVYYNVAATKPITFTLVDEQGRQLYREKNGELLPITIVADVTLTASFDYWDSRNECPPLQYYWQWQQGGIYDYSQAFWGWSATYSAVSGMDFVLGGDAENSLAHVSAVEITKILVDEQGNRISPDAGQGITNTFKIYSWAGTEDPSVIGLDVGKYDTPASYPDGTSSNGRDGYIHVDTRDISVGNSGVGAIYDYDVPEGMVYIQEDPSTIKTDITGSIDDGESRDWHYRSTYIQTEYVWRQNGDLDQMHYSDTYKNGNGTYNSIPEILGTYTNANGGTEWNGFLEFYVYNVYDTGNTDIQVEKKWWEGFNSLPERFTITVNGVDYTYNKSDLRVVMELKQYEDGSTAPNSILKDVEALGIDPANPTITLSGSADPDSTAGAGEFEAWTAMWKDLPTKSADGNHTYTYKAEEVKVYDNADASQMNLLGTVFTNTQSEDGTLVINKPIASKTSVHLRKYWEGVSTEDEITIPENAKIDVILGRYKLVDNGTAVTDVTLSAPTSEDTGAVIRYIQKPNDSGKAPAAPDNLADRMKYVYDDEFAAQTSQTTYLELLSNSGNWEADIHDLDETDPSGNPYAYFIQAIIEHDLEEGTVPIIELESNGRVRTFSSASKKDLIVTNILPTYKSIEVTKIWRDENGKSYLGDWPEEMRDTKLTFTLYKGPDASHQTTTGRSGTIEYDATTGAGTVLTFDKLPEKDSDGNPIVYTVLENSVSGFTPTYAYDADGNAIVTNKESKGGLRVEKKWRGIPDTTGLPEVKFTLYQGLLNANGKVEEGNDSFGRMFWVYEDPQGTKYEHIVLNNANNWSWSGPSNLPTSIDYHGTIKNVGYLVMEEGVGSDGKFDTNQNIMLYYYTNSFGGSSNAFDHPGGAGFGDVDNDGKIEGTLYIHNQVNEYTSLEITKEDFYIYTPDPNHPGQYIRKKVTADYMRSTVLGVKILRRANYGNNQYSDWEDFGDEMLIGYDPDGSVVCDKGTNDFTLNKVQGGDWKFRINHSGNASNPLDTNSHQVGLPAKGYYYNIQTDTTDFVNFEYKIRETGLYSDHNKTPITDWEWRVHVKSDSGTAQNIVNYRASDLRIEKVWAGKPGASEVYVKIWRKEGEQPPVDFTNEISQDVILNGNRYGYLEDSSLIDTANKWLVIKNSGNSGGNITLHNIPLFEIVDNNNPHYPYQYYAVEVGYKDNNGMVHTTTYDYGTTDFDSTGLGDLAKFDPSYKLWVPETEDEDHNVVPAHWETIASNDPTEKIQTIGELGTNRIQITNTSRMEVEVRKEWQGFESSELADINEITFRIEQARTPYTNGRVSGNVVRSDLYFTTDAAGGNAQNATDCLTIRKTGGIKAKVEATGRTNYYKLTYQLDDTVPDWSLKVDGLQEVFVSAAGVEYHCTYKVWEVSVKDKNGNPVPCTTTYRVYDSDGNVLSTEDSQGNTVFGQNLSESGETGVITNTKASAGIVIKKIKQKANPTDADEYLTGAVFELWKKENPGDTTYSHHVTKSELDSLESDDQFTVATAAGFELEELSDGEYQIVEKQAPENYVILNNKPLTFTIENGSLTKVNGSEIESATEKMTLEYGVEFTPSSGGTKDTFAIPNTVGVELPHTGGSGTSLIYLLGGLLTGLGLLLLGRRRMLA